MIRGHAAKVNLTPRQIGIDEKAMAKGHRCMTLVCDLEEATVEYSGKDRKEASLAAYIEVLPKESLDSVEAIRLDMWPAYIGACLAKVPGADEKMVFDRFHIMRHVLVAVDMVRKQEYKARIKTGGDTLARSKYLRLTNPENLNEPSKGHFNELRTMELKNGRA